MERLLALELADGGTVYIDVEDSSAPITRGVHQGALVTEAGETLERALSQLGPVVRGIVSQIRNVADAPDELEVEFNIRFSADASLIIARSGAEATFRIALRWASERPH